jgi:hypothetical protein
MSGPLHHRHLQRARQPRFLNPSINERYQYYEMLKRQLTASARTPAEYDAAALEAARRAGV